MSARRISAGPLRERRGGYQPPGGYSWVASWAMHPPFSFRSCPKRKRAVHGPKEKGARRAPVQWPSARDGGRRIGASADFAWPSGTLFSSARSILPSRGGWCGGRRGARTHLTSSSFRAFRFATRCPGGRGGLYHTGPKTFPHPRRGRCPHRPVGESSQKECRGGNLPPAETDMIMSQPQHQEKSAARWPRLIFELE